MRIVIPLLAALLFAMAVPCVYAEGAQDTEDADKYLKPPKLVAKSAILIDAKTGNVLYEKKADTKRKPASCTKILTALLAIENMNPDDIITVTDEAAGTEGSSVGLVDGEEIRTEDLLYAALLESGNDAAAALAVGVAGSVEQFAVRMNERVAELGLTQSCFANPHGLDDPEHYTTARNLALIAREAMKNEDFRKYVTTYTYTMPETNLQPERLLHNSNRLLYDKSRKVTVYGDSVPVKQDEITGIKTGYTSKAGNCLVSGMSRDGLELISVVLKGSGMSHYADTLSLLEYGMHNFEDKTYLKKGDAMFERPVVNSGDEPMNIVLSGDLIATVDKNHISEYYVDGEVTGETTGGGLLAPIKAGDKVGTAWVKTHEGQVLSTVDLVAETSIGLKKDDPLMDIISDEEVSPLSIILKIVGVIVLVAVIIVVISVARSAAKRRIRRRNRMYGAKLKDSVDPREVRRIKNINNNTRRK
ncbi:MAG: D-alanyl-D-alanine carboxypeptidase [Clostridiales Family XIII bacterium]|jgi:D-alanyl-D-alanine carboxypeptidase (penicillin-binding protein 5/6)|nr:D-alanyl-D-alanine carboxypeptidase [Clostridiales Family XIII bacterium]